MVLRIKSKKVLLILFYITLFNLLGFAKIINLQSASTVMIISCSHLNSRKMMLLMMRN
jgi:hypothetical protein